MKTTKEAWCYYSVHFGCFCPERDPRRKRCAERLTNAVTWTVHRRPRGVSRDYEGQVPKRAHTGTREFSAELHAE